MATAARELAFDVLKAVESRGAYANLELERRLGEARLEGRDAALATELVYGTLRNASLLDLCFLSLAEKGRVKWSAAVRRAARMAAYELLFLDRVPAHAAISEAMKLTEGVKDAGGRKFLNAALGRIAAGFDWRPLVEAKPTRPERLAAECSHPLWFVERLIAAYDEDIAGQVLKVNNEPQNLCLRVNVGRTEPASLAEAMRKEGFGATPDPGLPQAILLGRDRGFPRSFYDEGMVTPQDPSMIWASLWARPEPGMRILDLCCGTGGKTCAMAELMEGEGEVTALDRSPGKIEKLKGNVRRLKLKNVRPLRADALEPPDLGTFDAVVLDAPCTGTATFRKRPELRWRVKEKDVEALAALQFDLLKSAARFVREGGALVYITCSLLTEENERVVERFLGWRDHAFLNEGPGGAKIGFDLDDSQTALPTVWDANGAFVARMVRRTQTP